MVMMPSQRHVTLSFLSLNLLAFLGLVNGLTLGQPRSKNANENELGERNQAASVTLHTWQSRDLEIHYRGSGESPEKVRENGGLKAHNKLSDDKSNNLDNHVKEKHVSNYVSASSEKRVAIRFARDEILRPNRPPVAYVYRVKSTPNAVNVVASYQAARIPLNDKYIAEKEWAYLGGIKHDQIMEVTKITKEENGQFQVWPAEEVSTYNHKYDEFRGGGAQPGLLKPAEGTSFTTQAEAFLSNEANTHAREIIGKDYAVILKPHQRPPAKVPESVPEPKTQASCPRSPQGPVGVRAMCQGHKRPPAGAKPGVSESPKGEKKPAGSADPEGINRPKLEKPANGGNTGGLEPGKPPSQPASNPGVAQDDLIKKSKEIAKREFEALAKNFGVETIDAPSGKLGLADLHEKFAAVELPSKLKIGGNAAASGLNLALKGKQVLGLALYVKQVYDVFSEDSTALNRTAVVTSIIPFAKCAINAMVDAEADAKADGSAGLIEPQVKAEICLFADTLMFTPAWPVGVAAHILLSSLDTLLPDWTRYLSFETHQRKRNDLWEAHIASREQYIKSDNFTRAVETAFDTEVAALIYAASVAEGALRAGQDILSKEQRPLPSSPPQPAALDEALQSKLCEALTTRREKLRTDYLAAMSLDKEEQPVTNVYLEKWRVNMAIAAMFLRGGRQKLDTMKMTEVQLLKSRPESKKSPEYAKVLESRVSALLGSKFDKTPCK